MTGAQDWNETKWTNTDWVEKVLVGNGWEHSTSIRVVPYTGHPQCTEGQSQSDRVEEGTRTNESTVTWTSGPSPTPFLPGTLRPGHQETRTPSTSPKTNSVTGTRVNRHLLVPAPTSCNETAESPPGFLFVTPGTDSPTRHQTTGYEKRRRIGPHYDRGTP